MNRVFSLTVSLPKTCVRRLSATEVRCKDPALAKIKQKQMHFQRDDDTPMYLRGGFSDQFLYYTTCGLIFAGLAASMHSTYKLANKK